MRCLHLDSAKLASGPAPVRPHMRRSTLPNEFVQKLEAAIGVHATTVALPSLRKACDAYSTTALTFRGRCEDVMGMVSAARSFLALWDATDARSRYVLSRLMVRPSTPENLRTFVRAFHPPVQRKGHPVDWARKLFIHQVATAIRDAGATLESKHRGNLDRVVKVLLAALGEPSHDALDLRRDLAAVVAELGAESAPDVGEKVRLPFQEIRRAHKSRLSSN
jgi:hypothetical protein